MSPPEGVPDAAREGGAERAQSHATMEQLENKGAVQPNSTDASESLEAASKDKEESVDEKDELQRSDTVGHPAADPKHNTLAPPRNEATHGPIAERDKPTTPDHSDQEQAEESKPEIQDIMEQFKAQLPEAGAGAALSPTGSSLPVFQYPPRGSSLGNRSSSLDSSSGQGPATGDGDSRYESNRASVVLPTVAQPPLPEPEPESDLPFDFQRFLEQIKHRSADPVAKFLRSFLQEFGKRQWMVHEQTKIISDFLAFITRRMAQCEVWKSVSEAEFDNAKEGMEKLVMNRLYTQTFAPEISPPEPAKNRRRNATGPPLPGRKGQHQEDVERDEVLEQKIRIYGWIKEEHLDIKPFDDKGRRLLNIAQQELNKIKSYRAPRDKVICVLNTCKVLFGFLRASKSEQSADAFIPILIYTVIKADPDHLVSNMQYILRFRNPDKLTGEAGYYMSSLMGAVQFIEQLDKTSLTITDEEFEKNVEQAVSAIAERRPHEERKSSLPFNEKSQPSRPEVTARHSQEGEQSAPRRRERAPIASTTSADEDDDDENPAVAGLLRTIQKPFSTLGRIFSDDSEDGPARTPQPGSTPRASPAPGQLPARPPPGSQATPGTPSQQAAIRQARQRLAAEEAAARQASAETAEAQRVARAEHATVVETLSGMFPGLDKDVISDVVRMKEGRLVSGHSLACLLSC